MLATYEKPLKAAEPVLCIDEKPVQLLAEVRDPIPAREPGQIAKYDHEYERCGTANIFCAVEPKAGRHFTEVTPKRSGAEFAKMIQGVAQAYRQAKTIHLVLDNLSTHRRKMLTDHYGEQEGGDLWDRFTVHYTPKHGSWLNQAEIEISVLASQCLGKRRFACLGRLRRHVRAWNRRVNRSQLKINWRFDRKAARRKFKYRVRLKRSRT